MKFLADEGVSKIIVDSLRNEGYEVKYILEFYRGAANEDILQLANSENRILITQD